MKEKYGMLKPYEYNIFIAKIKTLLKFLKIFRMPCFIIDISVKRNTCAFNENNGILYFFYKLIGKCYYMYLSLIHVYTNKDKHNHNPCIACQN